MQSTKVRDPMQQLGVVDFEGAFFTVAIKEGSSEMPHLDFNDHPHSMTWVVPLGRFGGGHFVSPQLRRTIPVAAGQVMGAMTRYLLHSGTVVTEGSRLVLTCFTDHTLISHSERYHG